MLFHSLAFLFGFLPLCLAGYFLLGRLPQARWSQLWLAVASLLFYGYWRYVGAGVEARRHIAFMGLLCASTLGNYALGLWLRRGCRARWCLLAGVGANLALLAYFKYSAFGLDTVNALFGAHFAIPQLVLPLAISFYTFTQIAYLVDCHRGLTKEDNLLRYSLFVFFFPHLIAGPIVHHASLMPQFAAAGARRWNWDNAGRGACWLALGLVKKVALADAVAPLANSVFAHAADVGLVEAWAGLFAYAFQLYFDFSGYSDMAIGLGLFFNVRLPDNFNAPYRATDIVDFWRRWHMSLSRFLRDYLYIPLGGNRLGIARRYLNIFFTMAIGGLWHGAGWRFLLWGCYHGGLLVICHGWQRLDRPLPSVFARVLTLLAVLLGWVLFRADSLEQAGRLFRALTDLRFAGLQGFVAGVQLYHLALLAGLLVFTQVAPTTKSWIERQALDWRTGVQVGLLFCLGLFLIRNVHLQFAQSEFIYFRF